MISPVKAAVGPGYGALDDRLTAAIHLRFGLPAQIPVTVKRKIKKADKLSAWLEAVQIAGFSKAEADKFFGKQDPALIANLSIRLRPPVEVRNEFTARYQALKRHTKTLTKSPISMPTTGKRQRSPMLSRWTGVSSGFSRHSRWRTVYIQSEASPTKRTPQKVLVALFSQRRLRMRVL